MSVIAVNAVVAAFYIIVFFGVTVVHKFAAQHKQQDRPSIRNFSTPSNPYWTIYKYMAWRYTLLALFVRDKSYLLMQFLPLSMYAVALLRINTITLWTIGLAAISITIGVFMNEYWRLQDVKNVSDINKAPQDKVITTEETVRMCLSGLISVMLISVTTRIATSTSNLGQLNILSVLISYFSDQFVIRPTLFFIILAGVKIWEIQNKSLLKSPLICHFLVSEYMRAGFEQRVIPESSSSPPKKQEFSPSKVPKVSTSSRFPEQTNTLFDLLKQRYSFLQLRTSERNNQKEEEVARIDDICLDDRNIFVKDRPDEQNTQKSSHTKKSEMSEEFLCIDLNKENLAMTVRRESKQRHDHDDIYLAENFYPAKHEQTLPIAITLSPIRQRKPTRSKQKRNNRVLVLTGDSPYLEYLPNMLKKQQSQNKFKHNKDKERLQPLHIRSDILNSNLKQNPR